MKTSQITVEAHVPFFTCLNTLEHINITNFAQETIKHFLILNIKLVSYAIFYVKTCGINFIFK